jgi:hypothetical protein
MKRLLIPVLERHPTLLFSLGRFWLWILEIFKSPVMRWGQVLTYLVAYSTALDVEIQLHLIT